jgi:hypothetical protein
MPYYFDEEDESYWDDEYRKRFEKDDWDEDDIDYEVPKSLFKYIEPWQANATVLSFSETPGPEPEIPERIPYFRNASPAPSQGFFARLFGTEPAPAAQRPQPTSEQQWLENFRKIEEATCVHSLWKVARMTVPCRALGVKRVFGSFDGGGDESFTYFKAVEMRDGRVIPADELQREVRGVDCEHLVENAAQALMGGFDAGSFKLHGVLTIDFDACTITDETNADVVFGDKKPWEI